MVTYVTQLYYYVCIKYKLLNVCLYYTKVLIKATVLFTRKAVRECKLLPRQYYYIPHPKCLDILSDVQKFAQCARSLAKMNGAIEFLDHKNIGLDIKIIVQSGLVQKSW